MNDLQGKTALELLTKAWAVEYGPQGVRVNAVALGPTRTRMMDAAPEEVVNQHAAMAPAGRVAQPEELATAQPTSHDEGVTI